MRRGRYGLFQELVSNLPIAIGNSLPIHYRFLYNQIEFTRGRKILKNFEFELYENCESRVGLLEATIL